MCAFWNHSQCSIGDTKCFFTGVRICEIQHRRHGTLRYIYHHFSLSCQTIWQQATQNDNQFAWQGHTLLLSNKTPVERSVLVIHRSPLGQFIDPLHERERNNFRETSAVFATFATVFVLWCPLRTTPRALALYRDPRETSYPIRVAHVHAIFTSHTFRGEASCEWR